MWPELFTIVGFTVSTYTICQLSKECAELNREVKKYKEELVARDEAFAIIRQYIR